MCVINFQECFSEKNKKEKASFLKKAGLAKQTELKLAQKMGLFIKNVEIVISIGLRKVKI